MTKSLSSIRFFAAGYCRQLGRMAGLKTWKPMRFHAVFVYFEHPQHGPSLVDTGYSEHYSAETRSFPERTFRYLLPTTISVDENPVSQLRRVGIDPHSIRQIFITHFHIDHIGGLKCFPDATLIFRKDAYDHLHNLSRLQQVKSGFLKGLLPNDFRERSEGITVHEFSQSQCEFNGLQSFDYWGDGSFILVDLPGHSPGHFGMILNGEKQRFFYVVDACWNMQVLRTGLSLPNFALHAQYEPRAYLETQELLRAVEPSNFMLACHCPETMTYVD